MGDGVMRPMSELRESGVLWAMNRMLFHPRGLAIALHYDDDTLEEVVGWSVLGDGSEVWAFAGETDDEGFAQFSSFLAAAMTEGETE